MRVGLPKPIFKKGFYLITNVDFNLNPNYKIYIYYLKIELMIRKYLLNRIFLMIRNYLLSRMVAFKLEDVFIRFPLQTGFTDLERHLSIVFTVLVELKQRESNYRKTRSLKN